MKAWIFSGLLLTLGVGLGWGSAMIPQIQRSCQAEVVLNSEGRELNDIHEQIQKDPLLTSMVERSFLAADELRHREKLALLGASPNCGFIGRSTSWAWKLLDNSGYRHWMDLTRQSEEANAERRKLLARQAELWQASLPKYEEDHRIVCRMWLNLTRLEKLASQAHMDERGRGPCSTSCSSTTSQNLRKLYNSERKRFDDISGEFKEKWGDSLLKLERCGSAA